ncbi:hypothetical protein F5883DRAFT_177387 [Diaporthe sp. PMI_573]|nr:hypothetical protein F5883DRAFT_177387 [Diaporthaceae sp. PMI_573]
MPDRPPSRDSTSSRDSKKSGTSNRSKTSQTSGKSGASGGSGDSKDSKESKESKESYYSNTNMDPNDPGRVVPAASARRQVAEAPRKRQRYPSKEGGKRMPLSDYPEKIKNTEKLPLQAKSPWKGHPIVQDRPNYDPSIRDSMGGVRGIYNEADRSTFDVAYHDPTKGKDPRDNYSLGTYRPATHRDNGPPGGPTGGSSGQ